MTSKTVKYTLYQNAEAPTTWSSSDNDVTVTNDGTTHIVVSDLDHTSSRSADVIRQGTFDLDLTKDMNFNARFYNSISGEEIYLFDFTKLYGKQFIYACISVFIAFIAISIDVKFFERFSSIFYIISIRECC